MKRYTRPLLALLLTAILAGGGYWLYQSRFATASAKSSSTTYTQIVEVKQGSLSSTISVVGELDSTQSADLSFAHANGSTTLAKLNVAAGNSVTKGQVLASIDAASYQQALDQAKSDLQASEKKLADLQASATSLELAQADLASAQAEYQLQAAQAALDDILHPDIAKLQANVADAQNSLAKAQANLVAQQDQDSATKDQLAKLYQAEATPAAEYNRLAAETYSDESYQDRLRVAYNKMMDAQDARVTYETQQQANLISAQQQVRSAQQNLANAQKTLATAQAGGDKLDLAKAQLAVQSAQVALEKAKEDKATLLAGADATDLASAQADVDKKQLALADAQAAFDGATLTAPFDGTVLKTNLNPGDALTSSTVVLSLANLKSLQVIASIDEITIKRVATGQSAQITFDAFSGTTLQGKVLAVPLQGSLQNGVMVYDVPLSLEGADKLALLVGMTANVKIQVAQAQNTLLVPTLALSKSNGM